MAHRVLRTLNKQFLFVCHKLGFTLIELILVLAIVSILIITAQKPLLEFHQTAMQEQKKNCYSAGLPCIPDAGKIRVNSNRIRHYFSKSESG